MKYLNTFKVGNVDAVYSLTPKLMIYTLLPSIKDPDKVRKEILIEVNYCNLL